MEKENLNVSGVYKILCLVNGKFTLAAARTFVLVGMNTGMKGNVPRLKTK